MENKKRKMFAAIAVIMLCAVAIIGVGYAYTAQTKNAGNDVSTEYVTLHQDGDGAYKFTPANTTVKWNTSDYKDNEGAKTDFWLDGTTKTEITTDNYYDLVPLGNSFLVKAKQTGGTPGNMTCTVVAKGFTYQSNVDLFVKVVSNGNTTYMHLTANDVLTGNTFTLYPNAGGEYYDATVSVLYGYPSDDGYITVSHAVGTAPEGPKGSPIANGSLSFSISTDASVAANGITLTPSVADQHTITTATSDFTLTAAVLPAGANQKVIWKTSDDTVLNFTLDADGLIATLDGIAAGNATITATSLDGHFIAEYAIVVTAA